MKVMVITSIATGGGVTTAFISSLKMLRGEGHKTLAVVPVGFKYRNEVDRLADQVVDIVGLQRGGHLALPFQALALARVASRHRVDRILVINGRFVSPLKRLQGRPVICNFQGGKAGRAAGADRVMTNNVENQQLLLEAGVAPVKVGIVDNVLPWEELPPWFERSQRSQPVIGTLRLLEAAKGVDTFIDALALLSAQNPNFRALIGSDGSLRRQLEQRVRRHRLQRQVEFLGWLESAADFYRSIDFYVLPSRTEEWGLGVVEAQAHSLPVIATDCDGPRRLVASGVNGILVPRENPAALADALLQLIQTPVDARRIARSGYLSAQRYLMKNIQKDFVDFVTTEPPSCAATPRRGGSGIERTVRSVAGPKGAGEVVLLPNSQQAADPDERTERGHRQAAPRTRYPRRRR